MEGTRLGEEPHPRQVTQRVIGGSSEHWVTREELRLAIETWIERTYHRRRRQRVLGKLTPIEFETIYNQTALAA